MEQPTPEEIYAQMDAYYSKQTEEWLRGNSEPITARKGSNQPRRAKFLSKTGGRCWYCGVTLKGNHWVIEHQNGHTPGGKTKNETLVPACYPCNGRKGKMNLSEYRQYMKIERFFGETQ